MKRFDRALWVALVVYACRPGLPAQPAPAPPLPQVQTSASPASPVSPTVTPTASANTVELPPMLVEESISSVPWLYVNAGGTEFLSRCSVSTTRTLAEAWLAKLQLVRVLVPEEFLARMAVPEVFVLYAQDLQRTVSAEIERELSAGGDPARPGETPRGGGVNIALSMRLSDRDMHASIAYIDKSLFDASTLSISPGHVRFLLQGRVPELPTWLVDGLDRTYRRADFVIDPVTLGPLVWDNHSESDALGRNPTRPRAVLPASELFATNALRGVESRHRRRVETRASTQELFVRWAITSSATTREALWRFAARAAEGPVTEELFEADFGFDYSELRDRLSDYLPKALDETKRLNPGRTPAGLRIEVERATSNQIARIRGEWERLAIGHVQRRLPEVREPYIAQARRTLRRAYDAGDRDPRLLATLGLCEIDSGNPEGAQPFLEQATALGVVRPRAYYELARLRFATLREGVPETKVFSYSELAPVLQPLQQALKQAPPMAEVYALLAEAWANCELSPNAAELAELERGARLFPSRPTVGYPVALALARHGQPAAAAAVLHLNTAYAMDENMRATITRLRAELAR